MKTPDQSNEDIARQADRFQKRSEKRRASRTSFGRKAVPRGSKREKVLATAAVLGTLGVVGGIEASGENKPNQDAAPAPKKSPESLSVVAPVSETVTIPVTSVDSSEAQPIAVNQTVEFDADGQPIPETAEPTGGISLESEQDLPDSRSGGVTPPN